MSDFIDSVGVVHIYPNNLNTAQVEVLTSKGLRPLTELDITKQQLAASIQTQTKE